MIRRINPAGLALIERWEGCRLTAYQDVAGVWTLGYGHTEGVRRGMVWTQVRAGAEFARDLGATEGDVIEAIEGAATTDNQFAGLVALAYNIGAGAFLASTVLREHRAGEFAAASAAFVEWNKAHIDGELTEVDGLTNRRKAEAALYLRKETT
jgi:lysozyme